MVTNVKFDGDELKCNIVRRGEVLQKPELGGGKWTHKHLIEACVFLGTDYLKRPKGFGLKKVLEGVMSEWVQEDPGQQAKILQAAENASYKGYAKEFRATVNLISHYPVFDADVPDVPGDEDAMDDRDDQEVTIVPLKRIDGLDPNRRGFRSRWSDIIGWDAIGSFEATRVKPADAFYMAWWCRESVIPKVVPKPTDDEGNEQPYGSILDFNACPPCHIPTAAAITWLSFRRVPLPKSSSR